MASSRQNKRVIQRGKLFSALTSTRVDELQKTVFPAATEIEIAAMKANPLPIAGNYGTVVVPIARGFQSGVSEMETPGLENHTGRIR
jgi:hypothetical protein